MTLVIDGWSNSAMQSIYAVLVRFAHGRHQLIGLFELSSEIHSAANIKSMSNGLQTFDICLQLPTAKIARAPVYSLCCMSRRFKICLLLCRPHGGVDRRGGRP